MQQAILRLATVLLAGFLLVGAALGYWQWADPERLATAATNPRTLEAEARAGRGRILDRNGVVLASTAPDGSRRYSLPALAHLLGYTSVRFGRAGLEAAYDGDLRGSRGGSLLARLRGRLLREPQPGADLTLTIDAEIERVAAEALGGRPGAAVALHPRTGEVLALVSSPYFDPNALDDTWEQLRDDPTAPLVPRATEGLYTPGSIFKIVTASAAIDLNRVRLDGAHDCTTDLVVDGFRIAQRNHPHLQRVTFAQDFAWSDNVTFAKVGLGLGTAGPPIDLDDAAPRPYPWEQQGIAASVDRLLTYAQRFGFGERIPFDVPVAVSRTTPRDAFTPAELASTAFGQGGLQATPLLMALMTATIANGGAMPAPYVVARVESPDGAVWRPHAPGQRLRQVISPATAQKMGQLMVQSVEEGYARPARIAGVRVGGKTGTAEVGPGQPPHAWFVGYAPAEAPTVAVAVVFEHGGSGSEVAAPAARRIMEAALARQRAAGVASAPTAPLAAQWAGAYCPLPARG